MPKRGAAALTLTGLALALLLNFRTPDAPAVDRGTDGGSTPRPGSAAASGTTGRSGSGSSSGSGASSGSGSSGSRVFDGATADTRYGPVQVEITVANGRITDVTALQLPSEDRRSASISRRAEPVLHSEALSAQSASIDGVSGATYTSDGYARSLQSALDAAGI